MKKILYFFFIFFPFAIKTSDIGPDFIVDFNKSLDTAERPLDNKNSNDQKSEEYLSRITSMLPRRPVNKTLSKYMFNAIKS